jgi:hypothetical protein
MEHLNVLRMMPQEMNLASHIAANPLIVTHNPAWK